MKVEIGKSASYKKKFTAVDVNGFAAISGDDNPVHLDENYAEQSIFGRRIVHGVLVASMYSKIFGTIYPGRGAIYLSQSLKFIKPVYLNEEITAIATLIEFDETRKRGLFKTESINSKGDLVLVGEAKILFPDER